MTQPADKLNLDLLRTRDADEFARMVRLHEAFVLGLCQSLGLRAFDRDDVAAETFAIAYSGLQHFRGESDVRTWLYRIAYRTAMRMRRRYPQTALADDSPATEPAPGPAETVAERETQEAIWNAVTSLDPEQAAAVEMYYRRGMSIEEVAAIMEKPPGTVKTLLHRGRERLKFLLRGLDVT